MNIFRLIFLFLFPMSLFAISADCEVFFSPQDHLADRLVELINKEKKSIKLAAYSLNHLGIAKALNQAKKRGVQVEVLVDPFSIKSRCSIGKLVDEKIPIFVFDRHLHIGEGKKKSLLHNSFCVFGEDTIWTGSFHFTNESHLHNHENAITISSRELAKKYLAKFSWMKLYESRPFQEFIAIYPKKKREKKKENSYPDGVGEKDEHSAHSL